MTFIKSAIKAFFGAAIALVGSLALLVTGDETLANVTQAEWLVVTGEVLAVFSAVYFPTNKTASGAHASAPTGI
jgi:hypothetical protein